MDYEKTQKNNPYQLTINQHCFPARSISRFTNHEGSVQVFLLKNSKLFNAKPDNEIFCVKRAWDQRAESNYMKDIEYKYQSIADEVVSGNLLMLKDKHHEIINEMFLLWMFRCYWAYRLVEDVKLEGVEPSENISKDTKELLEKAGIATVGSDSAVAGRSCRGIKIQHYVDMFSESLSGTQWGIISTKNGELLVPDIIDLMLIPLTPKMCFAANCDSGFIEGCYLKQINLLNLQKANKYYFARDISKCLLPE